MFNQNSSLVKIWANKVKTGEVQLSEVPCLFNLYEEVKKAVVA